MRKAALLFNPDSGGSRARRRQAELESVLALLRNANVEAELVLSDSRSHAKEKAREAVLAGCDTVFACGGDGTIHNMIQVLANTPVALAILPMGTANALAHDLGLPMNISAAAQATLNAVPRRVAVGRIQCVDLEGQPRDRFFIVAAGAGVDAHLFYKLHAGTKQRMGMTAYYTKAWQLWFSHPMTRFRVEFAETGSEQAQRADVTELMAVRIRNGARADFGVEPPVTLILQGASLQDLTADLMDQLGLSSPDLGAEDLKSTDTVRDRAQQRAAARHGAAMRRKRGQNQ